MLLGFGIVVKKNGSTQICDNFNYIRNIIREHRFNWRKNRLIKMEYDRNKTEEEIMLELGHYRIYNAGNKKWVYSRGGPS